MAMRKHHQKLGKEHYAGLDPRRAQEREDGAMLNEDRSAMANMPQNVIMRYFPSVDGDMREDLDDSIGGVDRQMRADNNKRREHMSPHKY